MIRTPSAAMLTLAVLLCHPLHILSAPPRTDVYGDPLPEGVRVRMGTIRLRHEDAHVTFSADGRTLISCGQFDGLVRHWDLASGRLLHERHLCRTPREKEKSLWVELGGRCAAMMMKDSVIEICVRDVAASKRLHPRPGHTSSVRFLAVSPDGKMAVSAAGYRRSSGSSGKSD